MIFLEKILDLLKNNKKLPYYQAERRIDIFINSFIEDIIRQHTCFTDAIYVAPEFPLKKKGTLTDHAPRIDYLMVSQKYKSALLIELKTDDSSYDCEQIKPYLENKNFKEWYDEFDKMKMEGYLHKKVALQNVIKDKFRDNLETYTIKVVVLKPTHTERDYRKLEDERSRISFVQLKDLNIETEYQEQWEILRKFILCNF